MAVMVTEWRVLHNGKLGKSTTALELIFLLIISIATKNIKWN